MDGSRLDVIPVPSLDRSGTPYEVTLALERDGVSLGSVGERCGYFVATLARRLLAARLDCSPQARVRPDPDDRFPDVTDATGADPELFAFRHRDRGDMAGAAELRCTLRTTPTWLRHDEGGEWRLSRRAWVEAWGSGGQGVRAVLTSGGLAAFLTGLVDEARGAGADYRDVLLSSSVRTPHPAARAIIDY